MINLQKFKNKEDFRNHGVNELGVSSKRFEDAYKVEVMPKSGVFTFPDYKTININDKEVNVPIMRGFDDKGLPFDVSFSAIQNGLFFADKNDQRPGLEQAKDVIKKSAKGVYYLVTTRLNPQLSGNIADVGFDMLLGRTFTTNELKGFGLRGVPEGGFKEHDRAIEAISPKTGYKFEIGVKITDEKQLIAYGLKEVEEKNEVVLPTEG